MKTMIIAEAGVNHNGDIELAKQLIDVAAKAGADLVKFQTFSADRLATRSALKAEYQNRNTDGSESQYEMLKRLELTPEMHSLLIDHCKKRAIGFLSTGFDEQSVDFLIEHGVDYIKIPSGEITNLPYLRHIGGIGKPIIMSSGMATLSEIEDALGVLEASGALREQITVLHCTTEYPTPMRDVNLRAMHTIRDFFSIDVGYSDHTLGIEVSTAAVALGAKVIEKHFTLDRTLPGPDHKASLEPNELMHMVDAIRNIEVALGDGIKRPSKSEQKNIPIARKSLVAAKSIRAGEILTAENIAVKRPGTGISPMQWDEIIGQKATHNYAEDELIKQ